MPPQLIAMQVSDGESQERPLLKVTRAEFGRLALVAGWQVKSIELFLRPKPPVRKPVAVGPNNLEVIDWAE